MNKDNNFGKRLQQIRKSKGLTQEKLAELAGIHEKHISKLETGYYKPSFETLDKILKVLDISAGDIGFEMKNVSVTNNIFYIKSMQILNSATEQELEYYYGLIKQGQIGIKILNNK